MYNKSRLDKYTENQLIPAPWEVFVQWRHKSCKPPTPPPQKQKQTKPPNSLRSQMDVTEIPICPVKQYTTRQCDTVCVFVLHCFLSRPQTVIMSQAAQQMCLIRGVLVQITHLFQCISCSHSNALFIFQLKHTSEQSCFLAAELLEM